MSRIGILGGTFDPVHYGHLVIAEDARAYLNLERVLFIPALHPPHKTHRIYSSFEHRANMVRLAIEGNAQFSTSLIEAERPGLSYTVDTLRQLHVDLGGDTDLFFIVGMDSLVNLPHWYKPEELLSLCRLVVAERAGYQADLAALNRLLPSLAERLELIDTPELSISSSDLQRRVFAGMPIRYQVPLAVEEYIRLHQLYLETPSSNAADTPSSRPICGRDRQ